MARHFGKPFLMMRYGTAQGNHNVRVSPFTVKPSSAFYDKDVGVYIVLSWPTGMIIVHEAHHDLELWRLQT